LFPIAQGADGKTIRSTNANRESRGLFRITGPSEEILPADTTKTGNAQCRTDLDGQVGSAVGIMSTAAGDRAQRTGDSA